eukprot:1140943-Pelagomonas_calceolata.AAC.1
MAQKACMRGAVCDIQCVLRAWSDGSWSSGRGASAVCAALGWIVVTRNDGCGTHGMDPGGGLWSHGMMGAAPTEWIQGMARGHSE